jgi:DNA-binding LacI/PurR family transcriptional regulator
MGKKFKNKDLAARLGVSGTLVSLVLNNKADQQGIRKDTQEKVISLARQMGYFEKLKEKDEISPVEKNPGVLGMIVSSFDEPFVNQITPFLQKAFSNIGVGFSIMTRDPNDQRYDRLVGSFKKYFSGLILLGDAADENTIRALKSTDYPFVLLEKSVKTLRLNTVGTDYCAGAHLIADHIEKLGYKNILIIADSKSNSSCNCIRDLLSALSEKPGINKPVSITVEKPLDDKPVYFSQFEEYLRPPYRTDVIILINACLAYPLLTFLRNKKLRIPQDVALVSMEEGIGFDLMISPITTLRKPLASIASKVANIIWTEVRNSGKGKFKRQVNICPELIVRNSCGTLN